nr:SusC/RagA family TonB-linked outer membrane protein [uncultured Draconibacterium sp.]
MAKFKSYFLFTLMVLGSCYLQTNHLYAQVQTGKQQITGVVVDDQGLPLPSVTVLLKGIGNGTITDTEGNYAIEAEKGQTLSFSFIGFKTQVIIVSDASVINVTMQPDDILFDEVVVTALGIKREKKALGYAVQDVKADDLTSTGDNNISTALQGKVAGVEIAQSGGGAGSSTRIDIRGASSLSDNNSPLWVIDGVPFNDGRDGSASEFGGTERAGASYDINPEDIESISVLKGANAAALYGSRAGNGVILVTTKSGKRSKGLGITYSGNVSFAEAAYLLDMQNTYGQGTEGIYSPNSSMSWGPAMEGQMLDSWTGETLPYTAQATQFEDFVRVAVSHNHNLAFSGGGANGAYRASIGRSDENGIYDGNEVSKTNFDFKGDYDVNSWLNVDTKFSYIKTKGENRPEMGYYSISNYFYRMPRNIRNQDLAPGYILNAQGEHIEKLYETPGPDNRNPYFLQAQIQNNDSRSRTFGYFAANIKFSDYLKLKLKYGLDYYHEDAQARRLYADNVSDQNPSYSTSSRFFQEENYEFLLSFNKDLNQNFTLGANMGGNLMKNGIHNLSSFSGRLADEKASFLEYGTNITSSEYFIDEEVQSLYGFAQLAYKNYLFLDVTARNDWSSTLPKDNNSYFYPSLSLSGVISDIVSLPKAINYFKVRSSWAQVGKGTSPQQLNSAYSVGTWNFNLLNANPQNVKINEDLKPEKSTSYEFGFDARLFQNRIGVDLTYYNEDTKNQILKVGLDQSAGYESKLINAGKIRNRGVELMLSTTPVKTKDFRFDVNFNFAKNKTTVEELDEDLKEFELGKLNYGGRIVATEGNMLGDLMGRTYKTTESGELIIDASGLPVRTDEEVVLGNFQADWTGAVSLRTDYKGAFISALISVREGGEIYSSTEREAILYGTAERTADMGRISRIVEGVHENGEINKELVTAQQYWTRLGSIEEEFVYDASFMKMKELAIGYSLPKSVLNKIANNPLQNVRISVVGRNLFYFYKHTPGTAPDASAYSSALSAQGFDFAPVPSTRTIGFSLNLGF